MTKVSELTGPKLAEWVARAQGWEDGIDGYHDPAWWSSDGEKRYLFTKRKYRPDINGGQAIGLVKLFCVSIMPLCDSFPCNEWSADLWKQVEELTDAEGDKSSRKLYNGFGKTPMEAACRAVVASVYGEEVDD